MRQHTLTLVLAALMALPAIAADEARFPDRPVKVMVGFAAGGPSDLVARAFSEHAAKAFDQPVIVENRAGANALLATEAFKHLTGTKMVHIPYRGAAPAVVDLIGGQVDLYFATVGSVLSHIQAG